MWPLSSMSVGVSSTFKWSQFHRNDAEYIVIGDVSFFYLCNQPSQIANTMGSTSIRYRSDAKVSDQYLMYVDPWVFAIWFMLQVLFICKTSAYFVICHVFIVFCYVCQAIKIIRFKRIYIHRLAFQGLPHLDKLHIDMCFLSSPPPMVNIQQSLSLLSVTNANLSFLPGS